MDALLCSAKSSLSKFAMAKRTIALFDVDGTLTVPRKVRGPAVRSELGARQWGASALTVAWL